MGTEGGKDRRDSDTGWDFCQMNITYVSSKSAFGVYSSILSSLRRYIPTQSRGSALLVPTGAE